MAVFTYFCTYFYSYFCICFAIEITYLMFLSLVADGALAPTAKLHGASHRSLNSTPRYVLPKRFSCTFTMKNHCAAPDKTHHKTQNVL